MSTLASELREVAVTLPDGGVRRYPAGTTAADIASDISKSLGKAALAARIDGRLADLSQPIDQDATLAIVTAADEAPALELIRHDAAHIMARAVQELWPDVKVTIGPVIENGWYYDFDRDEPFTPEDLATIETADAPDHRRPRPGAHRGLGARPGDPPLRGAWARPTRSSWSRRSRAPTRSGCTGTAPGRTSAAARTSPTPARSRPTPSS